MTQISHRHNSNRSRRYLIIAVPIVALLIYVGYRRNARYRRRIFRIIQAVPEHYDPQRIETFQSLLLSEESISSLISNGLPPKVEYVIFTPSQQRNFLSLYGHVCDQAIGKFAQKSDEILTTPLEPILTRFDRLAQKYEQEKQEMSSPTRTIPHVQMILWKYCAFHVGYANAFIDYDGVHLIRTWGDLLEPRKYERKFNRNFMVRLWDMEASSSSGIDNHGLIDTHIANDAFMVLDGKPSSQTVVLNTLVGLLTASYEVLASSLHSFVLWHNQQLYQIVERERRSEETKKFKKKNRIKKSSISTWEWLDCVCSPSVGNPDDSTSHRIELDSQSPRNISLVVASSTPSPYPFITNASSSSIIYLSQIQSPNIEKALRDGTHHDYMHSGVKLIQQIHTPLAYSSNLLFHCPRSTESPCCEVRRSDITRPPMPIESTTLDFHSSEVVFFLHHPLAPPNRRITSVEDPSEESVIHSLAGAVRLRLPFLHDQYHRMGQDMLMPSNPNNLDVMNTSLTSILREKLLEHQPSSTEDSHKLSLTPNFLHLLLENDCVPSQRDCQHCLKQLPPPKEAPGRFGCRGCEEKCGCLCTMLCSVRTPPKHVIKEVEVYPPVIKQSPTRLIPRIVHQTWFEVVNSTKYPKMSRMIESWKQEGWEYRFYDDTASAEYIKLHFPKEFLEAYEALIPGAFKADFFRYCVLLIDGGVYADIDIMLTSNLDKAIADDVGFMIPFDYPGRDINHGNCLWNGFLAAHPGHPILAKALELSVNMIRNRFTSVDIYDMMCPVPVFNVCDGFVILYYTGPCLLGMSINAFLGRDLQAQFEPGEIDLWEVEKKQTASTETRFVISPSDSRLLAVGRIVILENKLDDLGAHRFVWKDRNMMVCATDMPESDDRPKNVQHYSKSRQFHGVYGVKNLFKTNVIADENIRVVVKRS